MTDLQVRLTAAREAAHQGNWPEALAAYEALPEGCPLSADDHAAWADAAWWLGRVAECIAAFDRAFRGYLAADQPRSAAMMALGTAATFFLRGDALGGAGWLGRATDLLAGRPECPEQGYLSYLIEVEGALDGPDQSAVAAAARRVRDLGRRHADANLVAIGLLGEGRSLLRQGDVHTGMALLDESMVLVLSGDVLPDWAGNVYCHLMSACHELADLRRARFWVEATTRWLATLPAAVVVHRHLPGPPLAGPAGDGRLAGSEREAARVCADLADIAGAAAAEGHYQLGELARPAGRRGRRRAAYQRAHQLGRDPQPGLALLRAAQGRPDAGAASLRAALLVETANPLARARLRAAQAEIALARRRPATAADGGRGARRRWPRRTRAPASRPPRRHWRGALLLARAARPTRCRACTTPAGHGRSSRRPTTALRRVLLAGAYRSSATPTARTWS